MDSDTLLVLAHNIHTSPSCGGFKYHYTFDTEERTSFNYWPTKREAINAAVKEVRSRNEYIENMRKLERTHNDEGK